MSFRSIITASATGIRLILSRHGASNPRLFGSVSRRTDAPESDVDLLVDAEPECSLLDLCIAEEALEERFGRRFDVVTLEALHPSIRQGVVEEAVAL